MAPNILGTIAQGHPNWFPGQQKPPAPPKPPGGFLGTVKAGHPNWFPSVPGSPVGSVYHQGPATPGAAPNAQHPQNSATAQPGATKPAAGSPGDPSLDATYWANVFANNFKVNNQISGLNLQGSQSDTQLQNTLGQLNYAEPRAQLALEQRANQGGGLYSSVYGQNLGTLTQGYTDKQLSAQTAHDFLAGRIAAQIKALQEGEPIYNAGQAAASTARAARLAANDPGLGQGTGGLNTNPGGAGGGSKPGGTKPPVSNRAGKNAKGRLTVKVGTALGGGKGLNVGKTLPTLSGKPSAPSKHPPTTIRRSGIPGHGVVRTRLGGR